MFNKKPSQAEDSFVVSPSRLSSRISAISLAAPAAPSKSFCNWLISFPDSANDKNDLAPTTPTNSIAVFNLFDEFATLLIPCSRVIPFLFNSIKDLDNPVPATLPFKPLLANTPSKAAVFSILTPVALAAGATIFKLSLRASKFNAELDVLKDITSTTF